MPQAPSRRDEQRFRARDLLWVLPLAVFAGVGTLFSGASPEGGWSGRRAPSEDFGPPWADGSVPDLVGDGLLLAAAIVVLATLVQLAARALPAATLLVTGVLVGGYLALGFHDGPVYLVLVVSSFVTARQAPVRIWVRSVVPALVVALAGLVARELDGSDGFAVAALWRSSGTIGLTLAAGLLAGLLRNRRQAARERAQHAATAEQLRTAQELHDGVGHGLAVIAMQSGVALHVLERDPAAARAALEAIRDTSRESLGSLRVELSRLAGQPAPRRPRPGLAELPALVARVEASGVRVRLRDESPDDLSEAVEAAAFAIAQESLTNVLRHSGARQVDLTLTTTGGRLQLVVRDDGHGVSVHDEGMGLAGMRNRAAAIGGTLRAAPRPAGGFEVRADLPVEAP
ncbi:sensor histidine kinase [Ornithinimicrobium murale]|uniref:sensor histidine kinase n=1 Tax=Ornithinimicrobium murale TaxID=1050153 RepID=UPI000E0D6124|nr:histidine kinase [Ornithinimicrobium murale]